MQGPSTDKLVASGKIITPYPHTICDRHFPLRPRDEMKLAVIVQNLDEIKNVGLCRPTFEQAIRFASQVEKGGVHEGKTLVFPSEQFFSGDVLPSMPCWLTLVWRPQRLLSELCLYFVERPYWPKNTAVVGFTHY
jgi:hypothetical protein